MPRVCRRADADVMNVTGLSVQVLPTAADPQGLARQAMATGADQVQQIAQAAQTAQLIAGLPKGQYVDVRV